MLKKLKNKKGFTLVELIVVIVIVLILGAALVPNVFKYIERAKAANIKSDAAAIMTELQAEIAEREAIHGDASVTTVTKENVTYTLDDSKTVVTFTYTSGDYRASYNKAAALGENWQVFKGDATEPFWP